jgi:hypothetical protein
MFCGGLLKFATFDATIALAITAPHAYWEDEGDGAT